MTPTEVLELPMKDNDAEAPTIRAYLKALLSRVWEEEESFSGKRPFGNSGWKHEVWIALIDGGRDRRNAGLGWLCQRDR